MDKLDNVMVFVLVSEVGLEQPCTHDLRFPYFCLGELYGSCFFLFLFNINRNT
jgi:hypothetical protein